MSCASSARVEKEEADYERNIGTIITRIVTAHRPFAQRRLRGGSRCFAVADTAGGRENEPAFGGLPGFSKRRPTVQQLLAVPRAQCLHAGRRQYQSGRLVQILGQKGRLVVP
jgi:hypothetical protein